MAGKKIPISQYILNNSCIDFSDESFIRWVYYDGIKTNYMVTCDGDIISVRKKTKKYLRVYEDKDGYFRVVIRVNGKPHYIGVHKLVATAFIPNDDPEHKNQPNHLNGDHKDNRAVNLEWVTCKENIHHAWNSGLSKSKYCDDHPNSVYTNKQIHDVCKLLVENEKTMKEISKVTNVTYTVVKQIRNHIIWNKISDLYDFSHYNVDGRRRCKVMIKKKKKKPTTKSRKK